MKARVIHIITKLELGGAQQNTLYTVEHLDKSRFSVALWSGDGGILSDDARKLSGVDFVIVPELVREVRPGLDFAALNKLRRMLVREIKSSNLPVIVHTHSSKAGILGRWAAKLAGVPTIIHTFHGFGFNDFQPWTKKSIFILAEWMTARITDRFIAVSKANLTRAVELGIAGDENIRVIRSGIKIKEFEPGPIDIAKKKRSLGLEPDRPLVLMVACMKPQKNPLDFVRAAKRVSSAVPQAQFMIAGDGELRPSVEAAIHEEGLDKKFKLPGWRRDVPELLWSADVLVLTSLWEGLPRVYPQAMAAGVPIVGTRVDGGAEAVIDGENGWLLPPGDVDGISARIIEILQEPQKAKAMGEAGKSILSQFDIDLMVRQQVKLYEEELEKARGLVVEA